MSASGIFSPANKGQGQGHRLSKGVLLTTVHRLDNQRLGGIVAGIGALQLLVVAVVEGAGAAAHLIAAPAQEQRHKRDDFPSRK